MNEKDKKTFFTIVISLIFVGSIFGFALSSRSDSDTNPEKLPESNVLTEPLSEYQEYLILSQGKVIINFYRAENCFECPGIRLDLERKTTAFGPYVYLVDINANDTKIVLKGQTGEKQINAFNETLVDDFICKNLAVRPQRCILRDF